MSGHTRTSKRFVEVYESLWRVGELGQETCAHADPGSSTARLNGKFNWPFSLKLPSHIAASDGSKILGSQFLGQLPPSFSIGDFRTSITYELVVTVKMRHSIL